MSAAAERHSETARSRLVAVTSLGEAKGGLPVAASLGLALATPGAGAVVCDLGDGRGRRRALVASPAARRLETELRHDTPAVARGALCWVAVDEAGLDWRATVECCLATSAGLVLVHARPGGWRELLDSEPRLVAAALRVDPSRHRPLAGLAAIELRRRAVPLAVFPRAPNLVASRRALAGLDPGGELAARSARAATRLRPALRNESGQALPMVLGLAVAVVALAMLLAVLGLAATGGVRMQRAADLAAVSAARSLRDDHDRVFQPAHTESGTPNPAHLSDTQYRARAVAAANEAADRNGLQTAGIDVSFPNSGFAPTRVTVEVVARPQVGGSEPGGEIQVSATAEAYPLAASAPGEEVAMASGGGYSGPLDYRQGEGMRPDVADAFDRMAAAAEAAGHTLLVNSGFRSDAEQAALFQANPDPRWVAPPGTSLHRCGTELDLGPSAAYSWLAANAPRFGFAKRYACELGGF